MRKRLSTARRIAQQREAYWSSPVGQFENARTKFSSLQAYGDTHYDEVRWWGREALRLGEKYGFDVSGLREAIAHFESRIAVR